ncbi:hypothetical protein PRNP1_006350 [Phytophthora ramorum]
MAPASPSAAPPRKRSQPRDESVQPVLSAGPVVKRRRSSASAEDHIVDEQPPTVEEQDKTLDGAPDGQLFLVTVKTRGELQPCEDPTLEEQKLDQLLLQETQANDDADVAWAHEFAALDSLRCFAAHHQAQARRQLEKDVLTKLVLPAASSLRSAVTRNALLCVQDLILQLQTETATHLGAIVPVLLNRACSEKQFLRDLAREVLDTALDAGADETLLQPLLATSTTEKNAQIISVAGLYVTKCIVRMDRDDLRTFVLETRSSFLDEMAAFLNCKVVECKAATRRSCQHTRRVIGNEEFVALVKEKLSGSAQLDVLKASEIRKAAKPGHAKSSIRERMLQMKRQQQQQKKVQSGGSDISVVVVAPPPPRSRSSSAQPAPSS